MDSITLAIISLFVLNLFLIVWLIIVLKRVKTADQAGQVELILQKLKTELVEKQMEGILSLRQSLDNATKILNQRLSEGTSSLDKRLELFGEIENKLGQLTTQAKNIESVGKNIQSLSELLKPPKIRGQLGEILLENLLSEILPSAFYEMQYQFSSGQRVDAVIKLGDRFLPVDSKFPMEAFERYMSDENDATKKEFVNSFKKHIEAISSKYIRPDENSTDIALMYIPSEAIYYRFVSLEDSSGFDFAMAKKIIPSSPGHLYAFLATVTMLFKQANLSADSREFIDGMEFIKETISRLDRHHERLEGSLRSMSASIGKAKDESSKISGRIDRLMEPEQVTENTGEKEN